MDVGRVREFFTVYFTGPDRDIVRGAKQYIVRRSKVGKALHWLKSHNRAYVDIEIDAALVAELPESEVPESFIEHAVADPNELDFREHGPDTATAQHAPRCMRMAMDLHRQALAGKSRHI